MAERARSTKWIGCGAVALVQGLVVMAGLLAAAGVQGASGTATDAVRASINEVIRILEDKELKQPAKTDERRRRLEQVIAARFDFEEMAKRSLGSPWRNLNDQERQEFVTLFKRLLTNSYSGKIEGYSGEQVEYLNERVKQDFAEVRTKIVSGKLVVPLDYRMFTKDGEWRIYDVIIDGVSLVNNFGGQFKKILKDSSYAELVETLRKKAEEKPEEPKSEKKSSS